MQGDDLAAMLGVVGFLLCIFAWFYSEDRLRVRAERLAKVRQLQTDGPRSCLNYYDNCSCKACKRRDTWYEKEATYAARPAAKVDNPPLHDKRQSRGQWLNCWEFAILNKR